MEQPRFTKFRARIQSCRIPDFDFVPHRVVIFHEEEEGCPGHPLPEHFLPSPEEARRYAEEFIEFFRTAEPYRADYTFVIEDEVEDVTDKVMALAALVNMVEGMAGASSPAIDEAGLQSLAHARESFERGLGEIGSNRGTV